MTRRPGRFTRRLGDGLTYAFMAVAFLFFAWPLLWLVSLSLRTRQEVFLGVARFIPHKPTLDNFVNVLASGAFPVYLWNALKLSATSALLALVVAAPAAYAVSRMTFRGKGAFLMALMAVQMISPLVIMVPLYRYMNAIGLVGTHFGVTMVYVAIAVPVATWLLKGTMDGIPRSLDEAAMLDGCNRFSVFLRIILPLSVPGLASVFIISLIAGWSQFLVPFLLLSRDSMLPIGVGIFQYAGTQNDSSVQVLAAACLISAVPAIIAFLALQRLILGAMTAGAVKG